MNRVPLPSERLIPCLPAELSPLVFEHLDAVDFALARRTNTTWDEYVCATLHRRVLALVSPHVDDYDGLAARLLASGVVIGGFAALHILFPSNPSPRYLELFVPEGTDQALVSHLVEQEAFTVEPRRMDSEWEGSALDVDGDTVLEPSSGEGVEALTGPVDPAADEAPVAIDRHWTEGVRAVTVLIKKGFRVHIIPSVSPSPLYPLTAEFHSALFNYVGPVDFGSAYPRLTSNRRALLNLGDRFEIPDRLEDVHLSWQAAGWQLSVDWLPWSGEDRCKGPASYGCAVAERYFGDRFCASGPVTAVRGRRPEEQSAIETSVTAYWVRGGATCGEECHSGLEQVRWEGRVCVKALFHGM